MLTAEMLLNEKRIHRSFWIYRERNKCHLCNLLHYYRIVNSIVCIFTPRERTMVFNKNSRCMNRIDVSFFDTLYYYVASLKLVFSLNFSFCHVVSTWYAVVEIVGMCCTDVRDVLSCLCPSCSIGRVGMYDTTNLRECAIQYQVGRRIRRRVKIALYNISCF